MKTVFGFIFVVGGIVLAIYLALVVMLYGGIMQAIDCWGVNNSAVVWGIIRAVFCQAGIIPGYLLVKLGVSWLE